MKTWRNQAEAIRARMEKRKVDEAAAAARHAFLEAMLPQQIAFAKKCIREVLMPVLTDFVHILSGTPGKPVLHEYDRRAIGVTCDMDSQRFVVNVYLLPDSLVRIAVFLIQSQTEPHYRDFAFSATNDEIEEWFGSSLVKLYEYG
jgi:hypothetical protein